MTNRRQLLDAEAVGTAVGYDMFLMALNPKSRGTGLTWASVREMAQRMAVSQMPLSLSVPRTGSTREEMDGVAAHFALDTINHCLKVSGAEEWLPLPRPMQETLCPGSK